MLKSPLSYQGGKQRIASDIVNLINPIPEHPFFDLCCGSGAISIELVNRGFAPAQITMLDKSVWGLFWNLVGSATFDLTKFASYCKAIPKDRTLIQEYVKELSRLPADFDTAYVFLILQSAAFGGKAIWIKDGCWTNTTFRNYWQPTLTSSRRSPVNPMMPMPNTLFERVAEICERIVGVHGICDDISVILPNAGCVYIDPPYDNTTAYGYTFDVLGFVKRLNVPCFVSESKPLSEVAFPITGARRKGGISGKRNVANEEWLSRFN